ncbi:MAG: zinc ribbon domain-containing protein [Deltaproteobacteria bacterium]|nr:zinc ribbon domain-containing protein [Deltaproteobacteria bacterium]
MRCSNCGSENPAGKKFCGDCGSALSSHTQPGVAQSPRAESSASDIRITPGQTDASLGHPFIGPDRGFERRFPSPVSR